MSKRVLILGVLLAAMTSHVQADGPADNQVEQVRLVPPKGMELKAEERQELNKSLEALEVRLKELAASGNPQVEHYLPDVEIFARAVRLALRDDAFYEANDVERAHDLLLEGERRAKSLSIGALYWTGLQASAPFATVRGFRSHLDGTAQPYGVVMNGAAPRARADVWCRGRSEKGLELQFLSTRMKSFDPVPASGVIMIHPFGRYCNANKLAGEVDTLEAIEHAVKEYSIDPQRIAIRGFSMGGAAAWHLAVHYPDRWFAANPGAGFSETPDFLKVFQSENLKPFWFEERLWQCYDCPVWVRNLKMVPTIAYSGANDKQKQAADIMAKACWELPGEDRFELTHIVAPNTAHQVAPAARDEIERRLADLDAHRSLQSPKNLVFTTTTLRYHRAHWLTVDALEEHWKPATIRAVRSDKSVAVHVEPGIRQFTVDLGVADLANATDQLQFVLTTHSENQPIVKQIARKSDRTWGVTFRRVGDHWEQRSPLEPAVDGLQKRHGLQGPIDDAFLAPFVFVRPSGEGFHPATHAWVLAEMDRAVREWGRQMRGDVQVKTSDELTSDDLQNKNLILWGDPQSNPTISKIVDRLPIRWNQTELKMKGQDYSVTSHLPLLIYPNPLQSDRYVVLNSGFTYREYDYLNNARQVPKLPDWAIVDLAAPPNARWPGRIAEAGFFDEAWQIK